MSMFGTIGDAIASIFTPGEEPRQLRGQNMSRPDFGSARAPALQMTCDNCGMTQLVFFREWTCQHPGCKTPHVIPQETLDRLHDPERFEEIDVWLYWDQLRYLILRAKPTGDAIRVRAERRQIEKWQGAIDYHTDMQREMHEAVLKAIEDGRP